MSKSAKLIGQCVAAAAVAAAALFWSGEMPNAGGRSLVSSADAWVGAPATPRSFAGVARRTTRRAVAVGATAAGVATAGAVTAGTAVAVGAAAARNCVRVVGPYGRAATVCR